MPASKKANIPQTNQRSLAPHDICFGSNKFAFKRNENTLTSHLDPLYSTPCLNFDTQATMPTGVEETIGLAIGVAGLLTAFKGAVDGYLLVESIFDSDNGLRDLALDYRIEREKLRNWGDRFNVHAEREEDCLLSHEKHQIKVLMAEIFGRIEEFHKQADGFLECHGGSSHKVDYSHLVPTNPAPFHKQVQLHSEETKAMSETQMSKEQKKKFKWAIKNKERFKEVVQKLRKPTKISLDF